MFATKAGPLKAQLTAGAGVSYGARFPAARIPKPYTSPKSGIIMASQSDWPGCIIAAAILDRRWQLRTEARIVSRHRNARRLVIAKRQGRA